MLSVPGSRPSLFPKAARSGADHVMLDLEDAVAPDDKEAARAMVVTGLREVDWQGAGQTVTVRINDAGTPWMVGDIRAVVTGAGDYVDTLMVPKVTGPEEITRVSHLLDDLEQDQGISRPIGLEVLIETARGLACVNAIAGSDPVSRRSISAPETSGPKWVPALSRSGTVSGMPAAGTPSRP